MGQSTDGILVFGIQLPEEEGPVFLEEFDGQFDDFVDSLNGLPQWGERGYDGKNTMAFRNNYPIDLVLHCSYDYPMYILSVRGTGKSASRGYPKIINPAELTVTPEKISALKNFCEKYNIEWQEPQWYLCSMWG